MLGTLMELGISPIVTSGLIMQLLAGAKLIGEFFLYIRVGLPPGSGSHSYSYSTVKHNIGYLI